MMIDTVEVLYELQQFEFGSEMKTSAHRVDDLRRLLPVPLLAKYDRMARRGRRMVAVVRNGVCSECHMRLPIGTLFELSRGNPCLCDNCDRVLYQQKADTETHPTPALAESQS